MNKVLGEFKRTSREDFISDWTKVLVAYLVLWLCLLVNELCLGVITLSVLKEKLSMTNNYEFLMWAVVFLIVNALLPPDFQYEIVEDSGCICFKFAGKKPLIISKSFDIQKKTLYNLVLKDKETGKVIEIPYNKEVFKVLKEIQS